MSLFFKEEKFHSINETGKEINQILSRFIRGQLLDALIVGLLSSIGLSIIGLDFAFLIGFSAGIANIIPYVGPVVGCIPAIIVGVLSSHPINALWAVLVFFIVQQLDGAVISPKVVGDSTGLHPVFIMVAIIIGGYAGGILGMLLSVPIMGIIKLFVVKYYDKKQKLKCESKVKSKV
jgi:predicted PurR-regulated permease PerM